MRTDTQRVDWLIAAFENEAELAKLQAAFTLELRGRVAIDAAMGAKVVTPGEPMPEITALDLAGQELARIREVKGYSEERDDRYTTPEMAYASVCYILPKDLDRDIGLDDVPNIWPWAPDTYKPSPGDRKRELTKGIALALCELDRLLRAERRTIKRMQQPENMVADLGEPAFKVGDRVRIYTEKETQTVEEVAEGCAGEPEYRLAPSGAVVQAWLLEHVDG